MKILDSLATKSEKRARYLQRKGKIAFAQASVDLKLYSF